MDPIEIYYFSATGNSLAVARDMAQRLKAGLTPATRTMDRESIHSTAGAIGFVFPIYDFKPPPIMDDLVRKIEQLDSKYLFAVCTYGIAPARSLRQFDKVIRSCGGHLSAGFSVGMPHNGIGSGAVTPAQQETMFKDWQDRVDEVCTAIAGRENGRIESSHLLFDLFEPRIVRMLPSALKLVKQAVFKGITSLGFTPTQACNSCGICARICPVDNIEIVDGKPVWSDHCAGCFACLNWCPQEAITLGGLNMNIKPYHHPEVKISDLMKK